MAITWLHADRAITGDGKTVVADAWIGVDGQWIVEVDATRPEGVSAENTVELPGMTLIPGLLNIHDHVVRKSLRTLDTSVMPFGLQADALMKQEPVTLAYYAADNMRKYLYDEGITWVRDLGLGRGTVVPLRNAIKAGLMEGPEITTSINPITMTGGHCYRFSEIADGETGVMAAVRKLICDGADIIKFMGSGGLEHFPNEDPYRPQYTVKELAAGVEAAHDQGLDCAIHVYSNEGIRRAILAGVDNIEHGTLMDDKCLEMMAQHGLFWNPTMTGIREPIKFGPTICYIDELNERVFSVQEKAMKKAKAMGILIGAGTDSLGYIADEIEMIRATLEETPVQGLAHATSINAAIAKRKDLGLLEKGRRADIVAVQGDLTQSLAPLRHGVFCTWKDGRAYFKASR